MKLTLLAGAFFVTVVSVQAQAPIWGTVDPTILGTCTAEAHDSYTLDGGDGWRYRTWHPRTDLATGCVFGHEHGDNPANMVETQISARPVLFGYIGRRHNHDEPHEGFKVFVVNVGDVNNEGRTNRVYSRSIFHMGTGGPARFTTQLHSADIALIHPEFNLTAFTRLMMDTGGTGTACNPRKPAPVKDVMSLQSPCKLDSTYEIWSTTQRVRFAGRTVYQSFATPAVFDPVTVFNPADPTELVYVWDTRVNAILNWPNNPRGNYRGCDRESYAQPGYWYNATGRTTYYTDPMGQEVDSSHPSALEQTISLSNSLGAPATNDGLVQFKMRRSSCQQRSGLGWKN